MLRAVDPFDGAKPGFWRRGRKAPLPSACLSAGSRPWVYRTAQDTEFIEVQGQSWAPRLELGSKASSGLWFGRPFDTTHGPESIEGLTIPEAIPSEVEGQAGESKDW